MKPRLHLPAAAILLLAALLVPPGRASSQAAPAYTLIHLGTLGGPNSVANGINDAGQVAGIAHLPGGVRRAFRITPQGGDWFRDTNNDGANDLMQALGASNNTETLGAGINAAGQVGGRVESLQTTKVNPAIWSAAGSVTTLSPTYSYAEAINGLGDLAGHVSGRPNTEYAALWRLNNGKYSLVAIPSLGYAHGFAFGVNDSRQVVGTLTTGSTNVAFRWSAATGTTLLPVPAGHNGPHAYARAINAEGVAVGSSARDGSDHAVVWAGGTATDLGRTVSGVTWDHVELFGLNSGASFQAVGRARTATNSAYTGVLWNGSELVDLSLLTSGLPEGTVMETAAGINGSGLIVGHYRVGTVLRAFLLLPAAP